MRRRKRKTKITFYDGTLRVTLNGGEILCSKWLHSFLNEETVWYVLDGALLGLKTGEIWEPVTMQNVDFKWSDWILISA